MGHQKIRFLNHESHFMAFLILLCRQIDTNHSSISDISFSFPVILWIFDPFHRYHAVQITNQNEKGYISALTTRQASLQGCQDQSISTLSCHSLYLSAFASASVTSSPLSPSLPLWDLLWLFSLSIFWFLLSPGSETISKILLSSMPIR